MCKQSSRSARKGYVAAGRLIAKHARQIGSRFEEDWNQLAGVFALSFRPGDRTSSFSEKLLRPVGTSVAVVLGYCGEDMPLHGYAAHVKTDGHLCYRPSELLFSHDGRLRPQFGGSGRHLNARLNPTLTELLLDMDRCCHRRIQDMRFVSGVPMLPRIKLGFAPDQPLTFEVTEALRRLAARRAAVPFDKLATNPPVLVERLLSDTWTSVLSAPGAPGNPTDLLMIDAEYCTQASRALRVFEDFSELVGAMTWNPARAVDILRIENPAAAILARHGIEPANGFDQPIANETIDCLEREMREALGALAGRFSQEDIFDGLTQPDAPVVACTQAVSVMRTKLMPYWSECSTDCDLRTAARYPKDALLASGACRIQVLRQPAYGNPLQFPPEQLQRRADVDWTLDTWTPMNSEEPTLVLAAQPA